MLRRSIILGAVLALSACGHGPGNKARGPQGPEAIAIGESESVRADVRGRLAVLDPRGLKLLAVTDPNVLEAWNRSNITRVEMDLLRTGEAAPVAQTTLNVSSPSDLTIPVVVSNLRLDSEYRVATETFAGTVKIDNGVPADNTSAPFTTPQTLAGTYINYDVGDQVDIAREIDIPIRLKDRYFGGEARTGSGFTVTNGTILNPVAQETFGPVPTPTP